MYNDNVPFVSWIHELKNNVSLYYINVAKANFKSVVILFFRPETSWSCHEQIEDI